MPNVSAIIATKNREEHLRSVSLPSLARQQDAPTFELIVWDASDNEKSRAVVEEFAAVNTGIAVRYFKAPRVGLARQRNDAVKEARGDIIFFIDDDSEVSSNGLRVLAEMFADDGGLTGGCIPLDYQFPPGTKPTNLRVSGPLVRGYYSLFEPAKMASGYYPPVPPTSSGPLYYLFGCDMAFRKEVFQSHHFDERLHRFSNFAMCDDLIFSRVLLMEGHRFEVAKGGHVIHRAASGGRLRFGFDMGQVEGYSASLVWFTAAYPWSPWTIFPFIWARMGVFCGLVLACMRRPWQYHRWKRVAGYLAGILLFFWEEFFGFLKRKPQLS